jgi:hypothetical protein
LYSIWHNFAFLVSCTKKNLATLVQSFSHGKTQTLSKLVNRLGDLWSGFNLNATSERYFIVLNSVPSTVGGWANSFLRAVGSDSAVAVAPRCQ